MRSLAGKLLAALPGLLSLVGELAVSRRGLSLGFLLVAAFFIRSGWLHPALSADLRAVHIPLGLGNPVVATPEELLSPPHAFRWDSIGVVLFAVTGLGIFLVLWRPRWLGIAAGLLISAAIAANAMIAFNDPVLVERLDSQYEQRQLLVSVRAPVTEDVLVGFANGRIGPTGVPTGDEQRGDLGRGLVYLGYGRWLLAWGILGCLAGSAGPISRRLALTGVWTLLGFVLTCFVCYARLTAEYHWVQAKACESRGDLEMARHKLDQALQDLPTLKQLERTWLLAGKLDWQLSRHSAAARFFEVFQLSRNKERPRAVTFDEDLPWVIKGVPDYRQGVAQRSAGLLMTQPPGRVGVLDFLEPLSPSQGPAARSYKQLHDGQLRAAAELFGDLRSGCPPEMEPLVRNQQARIWAELAIAELQQTAVYLEGTFNYLPQDRHLTSSREAWRRAMTLAPERMDGPFCLAAIQARIDREHPAEVAAELERILKIIADPILRADLLSSLADVYFEAGRLQDARKLYAKAYDSFSLPKNVNNRAQKGLGGL